VTDSEKSSEEALLANRLLEMVNASWMSQAVSVAARLGLADLLERAPKSASELAATTACNERALRRLLRSLCALEICSERADGTFEITPMGRLLGTRSRCSVRSWATYWGTTAWPMWQQLLGAVQTGISPAGHDSFEHLEHDREGALVFNRAMVELTRLIAPQAARAYDFAGKRVADIGGGYGELLAAILETYPDATGILFDMEHAISEARHLFAERGLAARCQFVVGDFFREVPAGADAYVLKSIVHDWNDERSQIILQQCRRAMRPDSRLLLLERIMPEQLAPTPEHRAVARSDLHMLLALGAQERTHAGFVSLLRSSGLEMIQCWHAGLFSWVEAQTVR
jgi:orsellinic acid C2-O-methyltransferase